MTREELLDALREMHGYHFDKERVHCKADDLLLAFIGDAEVTEAFNKIEKWYA